MFQFHWVLLHQVFDHLDPRVFFSWQSFGDFRPNGIPRGQGPFKLLDVFF